MHYGAMNKVARSTSRVTRKVQVTIPEEIRDSLDIGEGSVLHFFAEGDRIIGVRINDDLESVYGAVEHEKGPIDFKELRKRAKGAVSRRAVGDLEGKWTKIVDANVLIRYLTSDDKGKGERCKDLPVSSGEELLITDLAPAEVIWVLESRYDMADEDIFRVVSPIVSAPQPPVRGVLLDALYLYNENKVDFIDAYHAALGRWIEAESVYSYDAKDFEKPGFPREEPRDRP